MYEQETTFYEANKVQLRQKYLGKELVIVGDKIIGVYDDLDTAVDETEKIRPLGTFCVKSVPVDPAWENWEIFSV
ncbi:hypothetical protein AGMMS50268_25180 [Spirochaetia bacterium]|nr:hypothetical protein AGMMS49546_31650 [Spirochaetia bacterium]GHV92015.1 hypothetical protein AGMMS50268_25180 [Spirochaetia bacterium]